MRMNAKRRRVLWGAVALLAAGLVVAPAIADDDDDGYRSSFVQLLWRIASLFGTSSSGSSGGINPTNLPLTTGDFSAYVSVPWKQIKAAEAHKLATGEGIVVAVLDGGFNLDHPDLDGGLASKAYDAIDDDDDPEDLGNGTDDDGDGVKDNGVGHGTFVAGMVLKAAPDAIVLPVRVRDDEGLGTNQQLIDGIEWAVDNGADVLNLSVEGAKVDDQKLNAALTDARKDGVVVVLAAGNDGLKALPKMAWTNDSIVVGAVDEDDEIASFSNYSVSFVGLMTFAPGVDIYGPVGAPKDTTNGLWSGTSFSTGIVSGAVALLLDNHPSWKPGKVRKELARSTDTVTKPGGGTLYYAGRINLLKAAKR